MDLHLKHWRNQEDESETQPPPSPKFPRLTLDTRSQSDQPALPLFVPNTRNTHLSPSPPPDDSTRFPRMGGGFFSRAQWQELELQALIYRHMLAGAAIPPELLQPIIKKTLIDNPHPYFLHYPHLQPALLQSGFWGRAALDPEPGRCRRTDGKKWRCARDVATGHKYCERHLHRGRNRSRKPVESPTSPAAATGAVAFTAKTPVGGGGKPFALSEPLSSTELLHLSQRSSERKTEKGHFGAQNEVTGNGRRSDGQVLRHFFDDWPRSLQEADNAGPVSVSATSLSISTPGIPSSDTSLKLSTGNTIETAAEPQELGLNWASGWGTNQVSSMGGPLAEALRSSVPNSPSPISVLHQLNRGNAAPETRYVST